jgi:tetratricopeptide (TPR) repeat protein
VCLLALMALAPQLSAADGTLPRTTLLVMPFENHSKTPGVDWISEACPEVLTQRMASAKVYAVSRDERVFAFDHAGVPLAVRPSRATTFRIAEQMGADYVVLGSYDVSGTTIQASAQLLEVKNLRLRQAMQSSGPLADFVELQTSLAWQLLRDMPNPPQMTQQQFSKAAAPIRLDAFESYVRGVVSTSRPQKIRYFKDALRLYPGYTAAAFQLGKVYYDGHDYEQSVVWLAKIPKDDPAAGEAAFLLGMSEYNRGNLDRAYAAFNSLVTRLPLTEVYNNLGVVDARRGRRTAATEYFSKAVAADPNDTDYRFNLALAHFKSGDNTSAAKELREELQLRPSDAEAKSLLEAINRGFTASAASSASAAATAGATNQPRIPIERIKRNYDEASYRQVEMEINNLSQQRLTK